MLTHAALASFAAALFSMMNPLGNIGVFATVKYAFFIRVDERCKQCICIGKKREKKCDGLGRR